MLPPAISWFRSTVWAARLGIALFLVDKPYNYDGLKAFIDQASPLYLDGAEVDCVEALERQSFKFNNPHVESTCGCGSSFQV